MTTIELEITYYTDSDLKPCVSVPLANSSKTVQLYQPDFDDLIRSGVDPRWRLSESGHVLQRGTKISIARIVAFAKKGDIVKLIDGDKTNLKRSNIVLTKGQGKSDPREMLSVENRPVRFQRITIKPKYLAPPWMLAKQTNQ